MPRTTKPPSYRKHKPTGQAVVTIDGKDYYLGKHATAASRKSYDALIGEWMTGGRRLLSRDGSHVTVTELIASYWKFARGYYRKGGHSTDELAGIKYAMRPLKRLYGQLAATEFGPLKLKTVRQAFIDADNSRKHVNQQVGRIKRCFKWGVENELVPPSVLHALLAVSGLRQGRTEARETPPVKPVPDAYVDVVKPFVSTQVWSMIELQRLTGMRSGETVIMRAMDIDMTGKVWLYRPESHKSEHHGFERVVDLGPRCQQIIKPFLRANTDAFLFSPSDARTEKHTNAKVRRRSNQKPTPRKTKRKVNEHYSRDSYRRAIYRACEAAGVPQWHPHQLRHLAATHFRKEYGLEVA